MAEVFGVIAGVVSLLDTATRTGKALRDIYGKVKNAPDLICALANDVADLGGVLDHIQSARESIEQMGGAAHAGLLRELQSRLDRARFVFGELDTLSKELASYGTSKKRIKWCLRERDALKLRDRLREVRSQLIEILISYGIINSNRMSRRFESVEVRLQSTENTLSRLQGSADDLGKELKLLQGFTMALDQTTNTAIDESRYFLRQSQSLHQKVSSDMNAHFQSIAKRLNSSQLSIQEISDDLSAISPAPPGSSDLRFQSPSAVVVSNEPNHVPNANLAPILGGRLPSAVQISLRRSCSSPICRCSCHSKQRPVRHFRLPRLWTHVLGSLFVHYSSYPALTPTCDSEICSTERFSSFCSVYTFPTWLVQLTVQVALQTSSAGGWQYQLVMHRRVRSTTDSILYLARGPDLKPLRTHLATKLATINDIDYKNGFSALHAVLAYGMRSPSDLESIRMLLAAGADPNWRDDTGVSPHEHAAELILSRRLPPSTSSELNNIFPVSVVLQDLELTFIHKIVLGIYSISLAEVLETGDEAVLDQANTKNRDGNTPLHYAAMLPNHATIRLLLAAGADPNVQDSRGQTPIFRALRQRMHENALILLDGAVDIRLHDSNAMDLLQWVAYGGNTAMAERALSLGAYIDSVNEWGETPLHRAIVTDNVAVARYLCNQGADVNRSNKQGVPPVAKAVICHAHGCLQLLLRRGIDFLYRDIDGDGLLHQSAVIADVETMAILSKADLSDYDTSITNNKGLSAMALFEQRPRSKVESLRAAFYALVKSIDDSRNKVTLTESDDEGLFSDAVEYQAHGHDY